jgi:hypothetical protein
MGVNFMGRVDGRFWPANSRAVKLRARMTDFSIFPSVLGKYEIGAADA